MSVVTRIAPSPTGMMHVGTARTALFSYLYAKRHGGKFLLRVEDTDRERSTTEAVDVILKGLDWLGIKFDGEPVFQGARADRHLEVVDELLRSGHAYPCFMTPEEAADAKKANPGKAFRSTFRDLPPPPAGLDRTISSSTPFVIRFKGPTEGETIVPDLVKGDVKFSNANFDDLVLLRSDGTPTYNLAVVVDDHDMGITHVIRGDDHMNNAGRQTLIYEALGWDVPKFAHLPLINGEDGKPLSKRNGDASVMDYAEMGYLPEAMRNYLARLGWGHGNDEIFSDAEAVEWFDVADVVSAPARWDAKKLLHMNHHYIGKLDGDALADYVLPLLNARGIWLRQEEWEADFGPVLELFRDNAHTLNELADVSAFVFSRPDTDAKAAAVLADPANKAVLTDVLDKMLVSTSPTSPRLWAITTEAAAMVGSGVKRWAEEEGIPMKVLGPAIRAALTGRTTAPDLGTILVALGVNESIARIKAAI